MTRSFAEYVTENGAVVRYQVRAPTNPQNASTCESTIRDSVWCGSSWIPVFRAKNVRTFVEEPAGTERLRPSLSITRTAALSIFMMFAHYGRCSRSSGMKRNNPAPARRAQRRVNARSSKALNWSEPPVQLELHWTLKERSTTGAPACEYSLHGQSLAYSALAS